MALRVCAGFGFCPHSLECQKQPASANCCWGSRNCGRKSWTPLALTDFPLFGLKFRPAEGVKPIIAGSYAVFGDEPIEDRVKHRGWNTPEFSLELDLLQALIRCPFERCEEQPVGLAQRVEMCGSEGPGPLGVPSSETGVRIDRT